MVKIEIKVTSQLFDGASTGTVNPPGTQIRVPCMGMDTGTLFGIRGCTRTHICQTHTRNSGFLVVVTLVYVE